MSSSSLVNSLVKKRYFTLDALPAATLPISGFGDYLKICWIAYSEARTEYNSDLCHSRKA